MPELQREEQKEPLPPGPTFAQTNRLQARLIERCIRSGGNEADWVAKNAARFRDLMENDDTMRSLVATDSNMAIDVVEEALAGDEEI